MAEPLEISFTFDGKRVAFRDGDTIGSALHRAGIKTISRSMKYHRPRGLYCCTGSCASCFVDVDGTPNVPACMRRAEEFTVKSQNRIGTAKRDLLGITDTVFPDGFEPHKAFTHPRIVNKLFLRAVRFMSGWGKAPKLGTATDDAPRRRQKTVDHLIIGGGYLGLKQAKSLAGKGKVLLVEEMSQLGGSANWDASEADTLVLAEAAPIWKGVEIWTDAVAFGIYGETIGVQRGKDLWELEAKQIYIAPGRHDGAPLFEGNDRPGILSLRGAKRLWYEHDVLPGKRIVAHGPMPEKFIDDLAAGGANVVATGAVTATEGSPVRRAKIGDTWHECDTVICNVAGVARVELFQQAGCELAWNNGLEPVRAADGKTSRKDVIALFGATP